VGVVENAGIHTGILYVCHCAEEQDGQTEEEAQDPDPQADTLGPGSSPQTARAQGLHQSQVAVHTNQHEEQNTADVDLSEVPLVALCDGDSPEGEAGDHDEVSSRQVPQVDISHSAGFPLQAEHTENQAVPQQPHHTDQTQEGRLQGGQPQPSFSVVTAGVQLWAHSWDQPV
uniref:Uncharacterized protein n=1 Tax=Seriola lalandi dorsalis TaxID=1841481 RepID=A0A3B4YJ87_SERLL